MWRAISMMCALILVGGCESAEDRCNVARVAASDAWQPVIDELTPYCSFLDGRDWTEAHRDGLDGLEHMFLGRATRWDVVAGNVGTCMEDYQPDLQAACRSVPRARTAATQGAVASRDAARTASDAIEALLGAHSTFASCMARIVAEDSADPQTQEAHERARPLVDAARAHSDALAASTLASRRDAARAASDASFNACQAVAP